MGHHDGMIKREDIKAVRRMIGEAGCGEAALAIFEREPMLGKCIAHHWARVSLLMEACGVTDEQAKPAMRQIVKMVVEILELQKLGQDKLLAGLLPSADSDGGAHAR